MSISVFQVINAMMQTDDDGKMDEGRRKQIEASSYYVVKILIMTDVTITKNGK